jgi:4-hydroxy-tetrahydrodipicolinate reductase
MLDESWDIEILETHHNQKVDAPSGTALALGAAAAEGRSVLLGDVRDSERNGLTGARKQGDIGFSVIRGGDVAGEHSVIFFGKDERIELTHKANDRVIFARGALKAAQFIVGKLGQQGLNGYFTMDDVLG